MASVDTKPVIDLSPSAKLVYKVLQYNGELTLKQIHEKSRLSSGTARDGLNKLDSAGLVETRVNIADARQQLYRLKHADTLDTN